MSRSTGGERVARVHLAVCNWHIFCRRAGRKPRRAHGKTLPSLRLDPPASGRVGTSKTAKLLSPRAWITTQVRQHRITLRLGIWCLQKFEGNRNTLPPGGSRLSEGRARASKNVSPSHDDTVDIRSIPNQNAMPTTNCEVHSSHSSPSPTGNFPEPDWQNPGVETASEHSARVSRSQWIRTRASFGSSRYSGRGRLGVRFDSAAPPPPSTWFGVAPFLGECLEDFRRLIANDVLALRHGANQSTKNGHAAQRQIGAAIVRADLDVHRHEWIASWVIADHQRSIATSGHDAKRVFFCHRCLGRSRRSEMGRGPQGAKTPGNKAENQGITQDWSAERQRKPEHTRSEGERLQVVQSGLAHVDAQTLSAPWSGRARPGAWFLETRHLGWCGRITSSSTRDCLQCEESSP